MRMFRGSLLIFVVVLLILQKHSSHVNGDDDGVACQTTADCRRKLTIAGVSTCVDGKCTNPFADGCFRAMHDHYLHLSDQEEQLHDDNIFSSGSTDSAAGSSSSSSSSPDGKRQPKKRICNSDDELLQDFSTCNKQPTTTGNRHKGRDDNIRNNLIYPEIRLLPGDWESSIFLAWMMQILLSELLDVPVTLETATARTKENGLSFYDVSNAMTYPTVPYNYDALKRAVELDGDCTRVNADDDQSTTSDGKNSDPDEKVVDACGHVMPEVWLAQRNAYNDALEEGYIEPPEGNGMVGKHSFMIPQRTAEMDPTLTSYHGLRGENREKLTRLFLRPTNWLDYCTIISPDNCTGSAAAAVTTTTTTTTMAGANNTNEDDPPAATRMPQTPEEEASYFFPPYYTGHFRPTDKNNCTMNPGTCSGHVIVPSCDWDTLTEGQMYHNDIGLTSDGPLEPNGGYSYFHMLEIWHAANHTKSHAFLWWWKPDGLDQLYADTDYALQPIFLPAPTDECEQNRVTNAARCSASRLDRIGETAVGSCDYPAHSLQKLVATSLYTSTVPEPEATRSPAYDFIEHFRISDLSVTIMLRQWIHAQVDTYGIDPRIAVCQWVYDNVDDLTDKLIPPGYPRVVHGSAYSSTSSWLQQQQGEAEQKYRFFVATPMFITAFSCGVVALSMALFATFVTIRYRQRYVFRYAHVPFVLWILAGLILVCIGAIVVAGPPHPTDNPYLCVLSPYLTTLGYTIELTPLLVKVSAVNHLLHQSKRFRKVRINISRLHIRVTTVVVGVLIYLTVWTIFVDPPRVVENYHLVDESTSSSSSSSLQGNEGNLYDSFNNGGKSGLISLSTSCRSSSGGWLLVSYIWQALLLVSALVLAVQSRDVKQEFNESRSLAFMVYSHTLFLVLRALIYSLPPDYFSGNVSSTITQSGFISLCLSLDSINTLVVYFVPKFFIIWNGTDSLEGGGGGSIASNATARSRRRRQYASSDAINRNNSEDTHTIAAAAAAAVVAAATTASGVGMVEGNGMGEHNNDGTISTGSTVPHRISYSGRQSRYSLEASASTHATKFISEDSPPPPQSDEIGELMSRVCGLLIKAAKTEDEYKRNNINTSNNDLGTDATSAVGSEDKVVRYNLLQTTPEEQLLQRGETDQADSKKGGEDEENKFCVIGGDSDNCISHGGITKDVDIPSRSFPISPIIITGQQEDYFLDKSELLQLRDLCNRLGRVQFDWERQVLESVNEKLGPKNGGGGVSPEKIYKKHI